jgi:hypothetical protein
MAPQLQQWHQVLMSKIKPSFDIQQRGSVNLPIRSSSTFGPQINRMSGTDWSHQQSAKLQNLLNRMNH